MEWPSKNVSQGGIFHIKKVNNDPENVKLIKLLNQETKFAMFNCRNPNYFLRKAESQRNLSLSKCSRNNERNCLMATSKIPVIRIRPTTSKRRSQQTIKESGVYQREKFLPLPDSRPDRQMIILRLQEKMANFGNKPIRVEKKAKKVKEKEECANRFDQLLKEIEERKEFLNEMTELGERKKYETMINDEIQLRIREMEKLNIK